MSSWDDIGVRGGAEVARDTYTGAGGLTGTLGLTDFLTSMANSSVPSSIPSNHPSSND